MTSRRGKGERGSRREGLKLKGRKGETLYALKLKMEQAANECFAVERLRMEHWAELAKACDNHVETVKGWVLQESGVSPDNLAIFAQAVRKPLGWFYDNLDGTGAGEPASPADEGLAQSAGRYLAGTPMSAAVQEEAGEDHPLPEATAAALDANEAARRAAFRKLIPDWQDLTPRQLRSRLLALTALWGRMVGEDGETN